MNLMKTSRALAAIALTTLGFAFPAEATVTTFFSNTSDCAGTNTASFSTNGPTIPMSLCIATTTEKTCGITYNLQSASAAQNNAFSVIGRTLGPAVNDGTADTFFDVTDPATGFSVVPQGTILVRPDGSGVPQPVMTMSSTAARAAALLRPAAINLNVVVAFTPVFAAGAEA